MITNEDFFDDKMLDIRCDYFEWYDCETDERHAYINSHLNNIRIYLEEKIPLLEEKIMCLEGKLAPKKEKKRVRREKSA